MVDNDVCTPYTTSQSVAYMYDPKLPHLMNVFIVLTLYHGKTCVSPVIFRVAYFGNPLQHVDLMAQLWTV